MTFRNAHRTLLAPNLVPAISRPIAHETAFRSHPEALFWMRLIVPPHRVGGATVAPQGGGNAPLAPQQLGRVEQEPQLPLADARNSPDKLSC